MNVVVANSISAKRVIAASIDCADVARFQSDVMDFVEFNQMLITAEKNRGMGMIVDQVV